MPEPIFAAALPEKIFHPYPHGSQILAASIKMTGRKYFSEKSPNFSATAHNCAGFSNHLSFLS